MSVNITPEQRVVECIALLNTASENVNSSKDIMCRVVDMLKPVTVARYPQPRTKPNTRMILPLILDGISSRDFTPGEFLYVSRYLIGFLKRDFPDMSTSLESQEPMQKPKRHSKNKSKYHKDTRPKKMKSHKLSSSSTHKPDQP